MTWIELDYHCALKTLSVICMLMVHLSKWPLITEQHASKIYSKLIKRFISFDKSEGKATIFQCLWPGTFSSLVDGPQHSHRSSVSDPRHRLWTASDQILIWRKQKEKKSVWGGKRTRTQTHTRRHTHIVICYLSNAGSLPWKINVSRQTALKILNFQKGLWMSKLTWKAHQMSASSWAL